MSKASRKERRLALRLMHPAPVQSVHTAAEPVSSNSATSNRTNSGSDDIRPKLAIASPEPLAAAPAFTSAKQILANRANAQHSTGPTTDAGKAKSSLNAVKSGLTGRTVLLPTDDVAACESLIADVIQRYSPAGPRENALAQMIADAEWRIERISTLEHGLDAIGNLEFADACADQPEHLRTSVIKTKTYAAYEKQFKNLALQEARIRRHRRNDIEELKELQAARQAKSEQEMKSAATPVGEAAAASGSTPGKNGFEFSTAEVTTPSTQTPPRDIASETMKETKKAS